MKKHPIFVCIFLSVIILAAGVSVAYYNTKTFAFDEDAVIFSRDKQGFNLLDYRFDYEIMKKDSKNFLNSAEAYLPKQPFSTAPYIVVGFELPFI